MSKSIYISQTCHEKCLTTHRIGKEHRVIDLRRFKLRLSDFMSEDDEDWYEAFQRIDDLSDALDKFKQ